MRRALGLFVLGLCLLAATGARAIDLSGTYVADLGFIGSCRFTFTQSGTSLDVAGPCTGPFGSATFTGSGTVDPLTGVFSVAGAASAFCTTFTLAGTGDGEEWTADGTCVSTSVQDIFGTKCTNGVVDPTEECEDGNLTDGDCCSARCTFEPSGSACSADANVCTADVCDGAGACVHPPLSAGTACTGDGNLCTDDACDGAGACLHAPNTLPCDDGNACSTGDTCAGGLCLGTGVAPACVGSIDLAGSWYVHSDPLGSSFFGTADAEFDAVQSGANLVLTHVRAAGSSPSASDGTGTGSINPATGTVHLTYPYSVFFEPLVANVDGVAAPDGITFTGTADIRLTFGNQLAYFGAVGGVQMIGPRACGNGRPEPGETCDDANTTSGDGCSATCQAESAVCGDGVVQTGEQCDDGNTEDGDCCSAQCQFTANVCRPAAGPCDVAEVCSQGVCPPDAGDVDGDGVCDAGDPCPDGNGSHTFLGVKRPRLILGGVNDGLTGNERLLLRAAFDLPAATPFADWDPTTMPTQLILTSGAGATLFAATLGQETYAGSGTRGWRHDAARRRWTWRDDTAAPENDMVSLRIAAAAKETGERVRVRVDGRADGVGGSLPALIAPGATPVQATISLGGTPGVRCGQSRFLAGNCVFADGGTRLACR